MCLGHRLLPNRDMLVTGVGGRVRLVRDGKLLPAAIATVPVTASGEGGLLGIATHPQLSPAIASSTSTTRLHERQSREPGWNAAVLQVEAKPHETKSSSTTSQLPSITTVDGFALVQMGCSTLVREMPAIQTPRRM